MCDSVGTCVQQLQHTAQVSAYRRRTTSERLAHTHALQSYSSQPDHLTKKRITHSNNAGKLLANRPTQLAIKMHEQRFRQADSVKAKQYEDTTYAMHLCFKAGP